MHTQACQTQCMGIDMCLHRLCIICECLICTSWSRRFTSGSVLPHFVGHRDRRLYRQMLQPGKTTTYYNFCPWKKKRALERNWEENVNSCWTDQLHGDTLGSSCLQDGLASQSWLWWFQHISRPITHTKFKEASGDASYFDSLQLLTASSFWSATWDIFLHVTLCTHMLKSHQKIWWIDYNHRMTMQINAGCDLHICIVEPLVKRMGSSRFCKTVCQCHIDNSINITANQLQCCNVNAVNGYKWCVWDLYTRVCLAHSPCA